MTLHPMKAIFPIRQLLACLPLLLVTSALAQGLPYEVENELRRAHIPVKATATLVQQVDSRAALISMNLKAPFNPASTMKLVTTGAALDLLGPTFSWKTQALATGKQLDGVLHGDLIFKGSGDPKFLMEDMWLFLRKIRATGIREIRGNLVLDRSNFEDRPFDAAAFDGAPEKAYNAGPDALLLNYAALQFSFAPNAAGNGVHVRLDPPLADFTLAAPALSNGNCDGWKERLEADVSPHGARFSGSYPANCGAMTWSMHPYRMNANDYFGAVFRQMWRDAGGTFRGAVISSTTPANAWPVTEWTSPLLPEIIRDINKFSNNVMARQLLLAIALQHGAPAKPERGAEAIKAWLAGKQIAAPELTIENGAGLSRIARISAGTMGKMLQAIWRSPLMPEFISSLPLAGQDGTMRRRVQEMNVAGNAHIKTGALKEVRTIAGYVLAASGKSYVIVSFINHPNAAGGRSAQDALLEWVYQHG
ncbi:MAG: D-alanyl-D-alanine carboxypeptidase/D-alanyl-D-alanine-endopeptidase [Burkholderiaceae bacterium]|nr:D-alanyl-D-alanine carboxypeptidase/D-alanyl-D-alanine-endopeptidase [Burkholderiaceae bacterium]